MFSNPFSNQVSPSCTAEEWRKLTRFPDYSVSNQGRIRCDNGRYAGTFRKFQTHPKGYLYVTLYDSDGKRVTQKVHRLVAGEFILNPENKPQINHKDGVKAHNWKGNLEWATNRENSRHAYDTGLNRANNRKLTFLQAEQIRVLYATDRFSTRDLGRRFGISFVGVQNILNNRQYRAA